MSGIAAIFHPGDPSIIPEEIYQLVEALVWRGPDHQGVWCGGGVALGAVQLWATLEDWDSCQPLLTADNNCVVMDGRLDNRPELGRILQIVPTELQTMSDTELLWAAYDKWGKACIDHLVGAFAFVIWDANRRTTFAARDALGLRTLFYFWDGRRFYAASTLQALRKLSFLNAQLDKEYVWDFLTSTFMGTFDPEATPLKEIRRLPGGHTLELNETGLAVRRYWKPWELAPLDYRENREYDEHFRSLFDEVIAAHCRAVGPLGAALSGGLDSSAVVSVTKELEREGIIPPQDFHTFTVLFDESLRKLIGPLIYQPKLDVVGEKYGLTVHKIESDDWMPMFAELPYHGRIPQDEPFVILSRPYRNMGYKIKQIQPDVRVLLTGLGADEALASSWLLIVDMLRKGHFRKAMQFAKPLAVAASITPGRVMFNLAAGGLGPRPLAYRLAQRQTGTWDMDLGFRFHFNIPRWAPDRKRLIRRSFNRLKLIPENFQDIAAQAAFERNILLLGDNVRLWDDQYIGTASGIEMRHPFYDRRIIEFFLRLPASQKFGPGGMTKHILRRAMANIVPTPPQSNGQEEGEGFHYIYRESLKMQWLEIEKMFAHSRAAAAGFIDPKIFLTELGMKRTGSGNSTDTAIITTLALEFWLRGFEDPIQPAPQAKTSTAAAYSPVIQESS